ncbi:MAG TPA: hypothetical protein VF052_04665 [Solirubrobacterales bacterium]
MIGPLEIALAAAALLIGATGTFSPCGLSMIETIGPTGHTGGRRTALAACVAFLPGAIAGGLLTFGTLALIGDAPHGAGGRATYAVAAGIAVLAAALEIRGTRIVPQIRRQLPEHWRRVMPMPVAAILYGVLLGMGFTTFVLSFGVWALAGVSLAVGDPALGLLIGAAFGIGRAIPIVVLAPAAGGPVGIRVTELMCERPGVYLGLRRGDAAALLVAALALIVVSGDAGARGGVAAQQATDPSTTIDALVYQRLGGQGVLRRGGAEVGLSGSNPTIGGRFIAVLSGGRVELLDRGTLAPIATVDAPRADSIAVSEEWLVYRAPLEGGGDGLFYRHVGNPAAPGPIAPLGTVGGSGQLSPPSLDGSTLVFGIATPSGSRIVQRTVGTRMHRALVRSGRLLLFDPAVSGRSFTYVRTDARRSLLMIRRRHRGGPGRVLFTVRRSTGILWTSALAPGTAYVTVMKPSSSGRDATIVQVSRKKGKRLRRRAPRGGGNHRF